MPPIDWEESDSIWDGIRGAERLWLLYGFFPRFSGARLTSLEVRGHSVSADLYLSEAVLDGYDADPPAGETDPRRAHSLVSFVWDRADQISLAAVENELESLWFERDGKFLITRFVDAALGNQGFIRARDVEVANLSRPAAAEWLGDRGAETLRISWTR